MLFVLFTATVMMILTTFIHAGAMVSGIGFDKRKQGSRNHHLHSKMFRVSAIVM